MNKFWNIITQIINILILIVGLIFSYLGLFKEAGAVIAIIGGLLILVSRVQIAILLFKSDKPKMPKIIWQNN